MGRACFINLHESHSTVSQWIDTSVNASTPVVTEQTQKGWWQPPRLRSEAIEGEERHATWLELFFDLVLVAAVSQLSASLNRDVSAYGILRFIILSIPIWWAWTGVTFYATRFDTDDVSDRIFYCLQMVGVAALAINVHDGLASTAGGFALAYASMRFLLVCQYLIASYFVPEARALTLRFATGFGLSGLLWLASVWQPAPIRFAFWLVGMVIDFGVPLTAGQIHARVPPHSAHLSERYGLFILVVLGETVMAAVSAISQQAHWHLYSGFSAVMGLLIAFSLWWLYFDHANQAPTTAMQNSGKIWLYQVWLYSHLLLVIALSLVGVGVQQIVLSNPLIEIPSLVKWFFCLGSALSLTAIGLIHTTSCYQGTRLRLKIWFPYWVGAVCLFLLVWLAPDKIWPVSWCGIVAVVCLTQVLIQLLSTPKVSNKSCNIG